MNNSVKVVPMEGQDGSDVVGNDISKHIATGTGADVSDGDSTKLAEMLATERELATKELATTTSSKTSNAGKEIAEEIAEEMYGSKSNDYESNLLHVNSVMEKHPHFFDPIVAKFPNFNLMLSVILVISFGFKAGNIDHTVKLVDFGEIECNRCRSSVAFFLRKR